MKKETIIKKCPYCGKMLTFDNKENKDMTWCEGCKSHVTFSITCEYDETKNDFDELILSIPQLKTFVNKLDYTLLENELFPNDSSENIIIPINCWFDKQFYISMYLLRNHSVVGRKFSYHGIPQYQIMIYPDVILIDIVCSITTLSGGTNNWNRDNTYSNTYNYLMKNHPYYISKTYFDKLLPGSFFSVRPEWREASKLLERYEQWKKEIKDYLYKYYLPSQKFKRVKWTKEYLLYDMIKIWYSDAIFQYKTKWLGDQSIDIFIPSQKIGIEYQGEQHYTQIDFFGGYYGYKEREERDQRKKAICEKHEVKIVDWIYSRMITKAEIISFLRHDCQIEDVCMEPDVDLKNVLCMDILNSISDNIKKTR